LLRKSFPQLLTAGIHGVVLTAAFAILLLLNTSSQFSEHAGHMQIYWRESFPPSLLSHPLQWMLWMLETHTGAMFAYPLGSQSGGSTLTFLLVIAGILRLRQRRDWWFLATTLGIFGLSYLAGALRRYPYGDTSRLVQHLGPVICLLAGCGIASLIETAKTIGRQQTLAKAVFTVMCLIIVGSSIVDVVRPYKARLDYIHVGFARWFWDPRRDSTDTYCVRSDLGYTFLSNAGQPRQICYQHIYSPKHWPGKPFMSVADLPTDRPVNIVIFSAEKNFEEGEVWDQWWALMMERFTHVDTIDHRLLEDTFGSRLDWSHYRIYRFAPKPKSP
ncbi:MAG: hypothetical protein KDA68_19975, partial [Planctomycetaceae bacterium]|nr:hypothetical protein [Planctomycetaceae bacterium]